MTAPDGLVSQADEAEAPAKPLTKMVMWRNRPWTIRSKPSARFLAQYEEDKMMAAIRTVIGEEQYEELLSLDPDVEGDEGMEGLLKACNRAWGMSPGN